MITQRNAQAMVPKLSEGSSTKVTSSPIDVHSVLILSHRRCQILFPEKCGSQVRGSMRVTLPACVLLHVCHVLLHVCHVACMCPPPELLGNTDRDPPPQQLDRQLSYHASPHYSLSGGKDTQIG